MPHIIVKLWPGKTDEQKQQLADNITKDVMRFLKYGDESVPVCSCMIRTTSPAHE